MDDLLTKQEKKIAEHLLDACSDKEIGEFLGIEATSVKAHIGRMCDKFEIWSGSKRVRLAILLHDRKEELGITCPNCPA